jgi:dihydroxyacid dehydratase/phosphogluconate dehydratase
VTGLASVHAVSGQWTQSGTSGPSSIPNTAPEVVFGSGFAVLQTEDRVRVALRKFTANALVDGETLKSRREALAKLGGYGFLESQTPWQEIRRGMVYQPTKGWCRSRP